MGQELVMLVEDKGLSSPAGRGWASRRAPRAEQKPHRRRSPFAPSYARALLIPAQPMEGGATFLGRGARLPLVAFLSLVMQESINSSGNPACHPCNNLRENAVNLLVFMLGTCLEIHFGPSRWHALAQREHVFGFVQPGAEGDGR